MCIHICEYQIQVHLHCLKIKFVLSYLNSNGSNSIRKNLSNSMDVREERIEGTSKDGTKHIWEDQMARPGSWIPRIVAEISEK